LVKKNFLVQGSWILLQGKSIWTRVAGSGLVKKKFWYRVAGFWYRVSRFCSRVAGFWSRVGEFCSRVGGKIRKILFLTELADNSGNRQLNF